VPVVCLWCAPGLCPWPVPLACAREPLVPAPPGRPHSGSTGWPLFTAVIGLICPWCAPGCARDLCPWPVPVVCPWCVPPLWQAPFWKYWAAPLFTACPQPLLLPRGLPLGRRLPPAHHQVPKLALTVRIPTLPPPSPPPWCASGCPDSVAAGAPPSSLVCRQWDAKVSLECIGHWLDLVNARGWIPASRSWGRTRAPSCPGSLCRSIPTTGTPPRSSCPSQGTQNVLQEYWNVLVPILMLKGAESSKPKICSPTHTL